MVELARAVVTLGLLVGARFRPLVRVLACRLLLWRFGVWLHLSVRLELPLQCGVEPVLYVVVGPARKILGDLGPAIAELLVRVDDGLVLLRRPFVLLDVWIQVIVPALAALLTNAPGKGLCDVAPVFSAELTDVLD